MNLHHLAVFYAVAETGSIAAASRRLHVSQPAVSRQIRDFEERLETVLFDRLPRGMRLNVSGDALAAYARRIFALERQAETTLAELQNLEIGYLAVGASTTIGNYLLPSVLAKYNHQYPGVHVTLEINNTEVIQQQLVEDRLDVGLTEGIVQAGDLHAEEFMSDDLVVVAAPNLMPANDREYAVREIAAMPWIARERGSGTRAVLEQALSAHDLALRPAMELASTEAIKRAVAAAVGIAVVSAITVKVELARGDLVQIPVQGFPCRRPLHLLQRRHREPGRAVAEFQGFLYRE